MTQDLGCNHAVGRSIQVTAGDSELFTYVYRATDRQLESPRPYLHPIRTLDGDPVSVFRPHDHVWHKGLTWSLPHFGHDNFWGGPTFSKETGYRQLENNGSMDHDRIDALDVSDDLVRFSHHPVLADAGRCARRRRVAVADHAAPPSASATPSW